MGCRRLTVQFTGLVHAPLSPELKTGLQVVEYGQIIYFSTEKDPIKQVSTQKMGGGVEKGNKKKYIKEREKGKE